MDQNAYTSPVTVPQEDDRSSIAPVPFIPSREEPMSSPQQYNNSSSRKQDLLSPEGQKQQNHRQKATATTTTARATSSSSTPLIPHLHSSSFQPSPIDDNPGNDDNDNGNHLSSPVTCLTPRKSLNHLFFRNKTNSKNNSSYVVGDDDEVVSAGTNDESTTPYQDNARSLREAAGLTCCPSLASLGDELEDGLTLHESSSASFLESSSSGQRASGSSPKQQRQLPFVAAATTTPAANNANDDDAEKRQLLCGALSFSSSAIDGASPDAVFWTSPPRPMGTARAARGCGDLHVMLQPQPTRPPRRTTSSLGEDNNNKEAK